MARTVLFLILITSITFGQHHTKSGDYNSETGLWSQNQSSSQLTPDVFTWNFAQSGIPYSILDVFFIDSTYGWAAHGGNGAMRTTDGGFNWISISFADTTFSTLYNGTYFINENTGWCVGGSVQIRKTTNGGINWTKQTAPPVAGVLNSVFFWNANTGIVIGRKNIQFNSFIAKTTNGGANWTEITATTNSNNELHDQYWFNDNTGWISGRDVLLYTTNGGLNYTNLYANIPPTSNGANALLSITFVNQQTGWIGGSNLDRNNIYKTTNGGANWVFQPNPVAGYTYAQINDVKFLSLDSGWAVHGTPFSGAIMFTTNGGTNWMIEDGTNTWFDCVTYYQRYKAWCGASSGNMYYTYLQQPVGIINNNNIPEGFALFQNYPNPFNPETVIRYTVGKESKVGLYIYNVKGELVDILINKRLAQGSYSINYQTQQLTSGVYFYSLYSDDHIITTKKLILIK